MNIGERPAPRFSDGDRVIWWGADGGVRARGCTVLDRRWCSPGTIVICLDTDRPFGMRTGTWLYRLDAEPRGWVPQEHLDPEQDDPPPSVTRERELEHA